MKTRKNLMICIFLFLLFINAAYADRINITKTAPNQINFGDILEVNITIVNLENKQLAIIVEEQISGADPIDPPEFIIQNMSDGGLIAWRPPYYEWKINLTPKETYNIIYKIKPLSFGDYHIGPTMVSVPSGETFYSNSVDVLVKPESNKICEPEKGENYFNNPEDCLSGSADGVCDLIKDGICDPDCTPESDPDCVTQTTLITKCGNGMCNKDENYGSCPQDCESGRRDGYCDGVKDGRCDPDCPEERDADCKGGANKFLIAIILLVVGIVAFLIFRSTKYGEQKYE